MPNVNILAYKNALKQAWKDGKMSSDESAMLDTLRKSLNITADEHMQIENDVRTELAGIIPENADIIAPTENSSGEGEVEAEVEMSGEGEGGEGEGGEGEGGEGNDIKGLLAQGKNAYHQGNYEDAIGYCDNVLLLDPDNSEALFFRKRALSKIEKLRGKEGKKAAASAEAEAAEVPEEMPAEVPPSDPEPAAEPESGGAETEVAGKKGKIAAGDPNCKSCGGKGECHWCKSSGKCYWCKGSGKCDKCNGAGNINGDECKSCKGSGKCHSCNGDGECYWCKGSGKCSKCSM